MLKTKLRIGIIGAGLIAQNSHVPAAMGTPNAILSAIVDPERERASQLSKAYGINPFIGSDISEIIDHIDAAIVCTPNDSHAPIAIECLAAGKHVLIEKPIATSTAEAEAILAASERGGAKVAVGYSTRFRESVILLKELLDTGTFGGIRRFVNQFGTAGGWSPLSGYNLRKGNAGGGVLVVTGTHFLDRMLFLWGYPSDAHMYSDAVAGPEANCQAFFGYGDSIQRLEGMAIYSKSTPLPGGTVIETEAGYVLLGELDQSEIILRPHDRTSTEHVIRRRIRRVFEPGLSSFQLQMDDFVDACLLDRAPRVDGQQGLASMKLLEELYVSNQPLDTEWYRKCEVNDQ